MSKNAESNKAEHIDIESEINIGEFRRKTDDELALKTSESLVDIPQNKPMKSTSIQNLRVDTIFEVRYKVS